MALLYANALLGGQDLARMFLPFVINKNYAHGLYQFPQWLSCTNRQPGQHLPEPFSALRLS